MMQNSFSLRGELQQLLNKLVAQTNSKGGLLAYNILDSRQLLYAGEVDSDIKLSDEEKQFLKQQTSFAKKDYYLHPLLQEDPEQPPQFIALICNSQIWKPVFKDLVQAYARLATQNLETHRKLNLVSEYTDSLLQQKQELEKLQTYNQNLLSITIHDLSSPLSAVSGCLEMMDECLADKFDSPQIQQFHKRIQSGVNDVSDMLKQLNEVVNFKRGFLTLNKATVDVNWIVADIGDLLQTDARKKEIELQLITQKKPAYIKADIVKFKRVLYNLVLNAIKYSSERQSISIRVASKEDQVYIRVKDNGIGIKEENLDTIFKPFVKLNQDKQNATSHGLGLYISSYFVKLMGGDISVQSQKGKGSTFTIVMPLAKASALPSKSA